MKVSALLLATACASAPAARPLERFTGTQPLQVTARGSLYSGTATLERAAEGLSGTFTLAGPVEVKGRLTARETSGTMTLELTYDIAQNGCKGTMRLMGPVNQSALVDGAMEAQDSCVGRMTGVFEFGRA
jgi:hypothetical protein